MNKSIFIVALAMAFLVLPGGVLAEKLPKHYPENFQRFGAISDIGKGFIVIGDSRYVLSSSTQVRTLRARFSTLNALKKGLQVGYTTTSERGGAIGKIAEIWVLPKRFKVENVE